MSGYLVTLPTHLQLSKKKKHPLNINHYRNAHFLELSNAKIAFENIVGPTLAHIPHMPRIQIEYKLFLGSKRKVDLTNIASIVDKFFQDTLVKAGVVDDDSVEYVCKTSSEFGGYVKGNSFMEAIVTAYEPMVAHS